MYIHLGKDVSVRTENIVGIFNMETATVSKDTREFLKKCEESNIVTNVSPDLPNSFVLCRFEGRAHLFISAISASTLRKRVDVLV